jgi:23S rRNA (uridine2552-2'-O)-methyltransferase
MSRELQDHYFKEAKRSGYRSRAAYKLLEIDDRKKVLAKGAAVLDCGAAPGSWVQVAAERVGPKGRVVGIDLKHVEPLQKFGNVTLIEGDLREIAASELLAPIRPGEDGKRFDVILSDMAPNTTGDRTIDHHQSVRLCHALLDRCGELLRPGGHLVMKVFEGEAYPDLLARMREAFGTVKGFKPKASRTISREMYVVAQSFSGASLREDDQPVAKPHPRPATGWKSPG